MIRIPDAILLVVAVLLAEACSKGAPLTRAQGDGSAESGSGGPAASGGNDARGGAGGSGSGGASGVGGSSPDTGGAGTCNALASTAPYIHANHVAAVPTPQGGTPSPGSYYLTALNQYTGPGGMTGVDHDELAETVWLTVSGNVVTIQLVQNDGPETVNVQQTMVLTLSGATTGTLQYTCPFTAAGPFAYTADGSTFHLFGGTAEEFVYTKQSDGPIDLLTACKAMQADFATALVAAQKCDPTATSQCQSAVEVPELGCPSCEVVIESAVGVGGMAAHFSQAGCSSLPGYLCPICQGPSGQCVAQPGGGGMCTQR